MVSNTTLATICVLSGLYKHLQFASSDLANQIAEHVTKIRTLHDEEHKAAEKENRLPCQFWVEEEPPKVCHRCRAVTELTQPFPFHRLYQTSSSLSWPLCT